MYKVGKKITKIITGRLLSINFGLCPFWPNFFLFLISHVCRGYRGILLLY